MNRILSTTAKVKTVDLLALSIGIVYLWFGALKFFPHVSPAEDLAKVTIDKLFFGFIPSHISIILLAIWEVVVGIFLLVNFKRRFAILLALVHMAFTFTPLFLLPEMSFTQLPFSFTLLGQYIVKNVIIVCALFIILRETAAVKK